MNRNGRIARWGALAVLVTLMSGCCVLPWGGRGGYYGGGGGGHYSGGGPGYGGGQGGYGGGYRHGG